MPPHPEWHQRRLDSYAKYRRTAKGRFKSLREGATPRGIPVEITLEQYVVITAARVCIYCSRELPEFGHGIDRKDNDIGYTLENSVPCCAECNSLKSNKLTFDEMVWIMAKRRIEGRL